MEAWHLWTILALALVIGEVFTAGFVLACFALGCLAAGLLAFWKFGYLLQLAAFSAMSIAAFLGVRPLALKHLAATSEPIKTNAEALVGKGGVVRERVDPSTSQGRVKVEGEDWWGITESGRPLEVGEKVVVVKVDGSRLVVELDAAETSVRHLGERGQTP